MTTPEQKRAALLRIKQFFARHRIERMPSDALFLEPLVDDLAKILKNQDEDSQLVVHAPPGTKIYYEPLPASDAECQGFLGQFNEHEWVWNNKANVFGCENCGGIKQLDIRGVLPGQTFSIDPGKKTRK